MQNSWTIQCDNCGKFVSHGELKKNGGASWVFVPDSDVSYEENKTYCKKCTKKVGRPYPSQSVRVDMCSGIY